MFSDRIKVELKQGEGTSREEVGIKTIWLPIINTLEKQRVNKHARKTAKGTKCWMFECGDRSSFHF